MTHSIRPPRPVKKRPPRKTRTEAKTALPQKKEMARNKVLLMVVGIVCAIAIAAGAFYYLVYVMPYQRVILTVGDDSIKTGYFLKRVAATSNLDAETTIESLKTELIVEQAAADFGLSTPTEEEIDVYLYDQARGDNETITDEEFDTWFDNQLTNIGLTAEEYREIVGRYLLYNQIQEIVSSNVSSVVPQVHLSVIVLDNNDAALSAKTRIDAGEDFATVAKEVSLDTTSKENGGDLGWLPTEFFSAEISAVIDVLDIGKCSDPYTNVNASSGSTTYMLFKVSEKSSAMQVTDDQLASLKSMAMTDWLQSQTATTEVIIHGLHGSTHLDSETLSWIDYQVQKIIKKRSSTSSQ